MYKSSILSVGLHFTIFFFAYYGLPDVKKHTVKEVPIDIVLDLPIKNKTNIKETTKKKSLKNKNSSNPQPKANLPKAEPIVSVKKPKIKKIQKSKKEIEKLAKKPKIGKDGVPNLTGMKMRATGTYRPLFRALGATTVNIKSSEIFTAMQRKTVDGYGMTDSALIAIGLQSVTNYRVWPNFYVTNQAHFA